LRGRAQRRTLPPRAGGDETGLTGNGKNGKQRDRRNICWLASASVVVSLLALSLPTAASGVFSTVQWELKGCPFAWDQRNAPVNIVWYSSADGTTSLNFLLAHFSWSSTDATDRYYQSMSDCGLRDWKRASASTSIPVGSTRYLIQARHTHESDLKWGKTVVSAVRRQKKISSSCFAVTSATATTASGYDLGRKKIYGVLASVPGNGFRSTYWGNTNTIHQCNNTDAGGNGWVHWWKVP